MTSFAKSLNIEIDENVINPDRIFSLSDSNKKLELSFQKAAPILWKEQDIKQCVIHQIASKSEHNLSIDLESIVAFIRENNNVFSLRPSKRFYQQHRDFQNIIIFNSESIIESMKKKVINEFFNLCNGYLLSLTLDKLFIAISDLNAVAMKDKVFLRHSQRNRFDDIEYQIINVIKLFFMVLETIYSHEVEDFISASQNIKTDFKYSIDTDNLFLICIETDELVKQILNPFQSASGKYNIPYFIYSTFFVTYLDIFPIVEVLISNYFNGFYDFTLENEEENLQAEIAKMIFQLLLFIPIFNKQGLFLSDFAAANHSFVNISWFLNILKDYYDVSFFEDIILETFKNEVRNVIENVIVNTKETADDVESMVNSLFQLYSLSTDNTNIHEKMKSILAFYQLKTS